jgi:hypothetical protein
VNVEQTPAVTPVHAPHAGKRGPSIAIALVAVVLAVAAIKPWSIGRSPAPTNAAPAASSEQGSAGSADVQAPPKPTAIADANAMNCMAEDVEQLLLIERSEGREVRSWIAFRDVHGDDVGRDVPSVELYSNDIVGLGICAPGSGAAPVPSGGLLPPAGKTAGSVIGIEWLAGPGATPRELAVPDPITLARLDGFAILYGPPMQRQPVPSPGSPGTSFWPAGTYDVRFRFPFDSVGTIRRVQLEIVARPET